MLQQRLFDSVRIISLDRDELLAVLGVIARRIRAEHPRVQSVRLFGSVARGEQVGTSDVDILIVIRSNEPGDPMADLQTFYRYFDLPISVDVLVYTEDHVARRLQSGDQLFSRMWEESRVLC